MTSYERATKKTFSFLGRRYYSWVMGDEKKPPVLIIEGFSGTHTDLIKVGESLKDEFFVIIPDLPGWGASPPLRITHSFQHEALFLKALLEDLHIKKTHILGHCMGATFAIEFAYQFPEIPNTLVLVSTPYEEGTTGTVLFRHFIEMGKNHPFLFRLWRNRYVNIVISMFMLKFRRMGRKLRVLKKIFHTPIYENLRVVSESWESLLDYDYTRITKIKAPIHLVYGDKDVLISADQQHKLHSLVPSASFDIISAGHIPPLEAPQTMATLAKKYFLGLL